MKIIKICNKVIEYSFYALFLLVPWVFTSSTFELFEFNKMWLTFALTIIIAASWFIKSAIQRQLRIQRTPLDIPILLFLLSQIIATFFSWDRHVSLWGYYSRLNGGLLSISAYVFLYYAFLSNFSFARGDTAGRAPDSAHRVRSEARLAGALAGGKAGAGPRANWLDKRQDPDAIIMVKRLLKLSLFSGLIVALWGLPSHFGFDPTCLIFRGSFDVSCWTEAFQPKVRIFSTLGQPDWLAAYLAILLPLSIFMFLKTIKTQTTSDKKFSIFNFQFSINHLFAICYLLFAILFYLDLLFTDSRSGFLAVWLALIFFATAYLYLNLARSNLAKLKVEFTKSFLKKFFLRYWYLLAVLVLMGGISFFAGTPFHQFDKLTLHGIKKELAKINKPKAEKTTPPQSPTSAPVGGGTESGQIRAIVWKGAIDAWKNNPLFGTGVETFAFAYYKYRPVEHNLVSEWDFLYNKAHNEYLNYLATTGILGLGSYLFMIGVFLTLTLTKITNLFANFAKLPFVSLVNSFRIFREKNEPLSHESKLLIIALLSGYLSILITNFFGFSVVITNLYLFLIPAFVFVLQGMIDPQRAFVFPKQKGSSEQKLSTPQWLLIVIILFSILYFLSTLFKFWLADRAFALGYNFDRVGQYQEAYPKLHEAVALRGDEPVFKDELAINEAILASALFSQKEATTAAFLTSEAVKISDELTKSHPNNVVFTKTRVRIFYALSQVDQKYLGRALEAILAAQKLAPTDAKISYNLGLLYGQNGNAEKAVQTLQQTIKLKPDYRDAYYALGLFYYDLGVNKNGRIVKPEFRQKAVETMKHLLDISGGQDAQAQQALKGWGEL